MASYSTLVCRQFHTSDSAYNGACSLVAITHDDVIKWKHFPRYWPLALCGELTGHRKLDPVRAWHRESVKPSPNPFMTRFNYVVMHHRASMSSKKYQLTHNNWFGHNIMENLCHDDTEPLHYSDVIMTTMASQITSITIVYSTVYSRHRSKKTLKLRVTGLCEGNSPVTGEFTAQRAKRRRHFLCPCVNLRLWRGANQLHWKQMLNDPQHLWATLNIPEPRQNGRHFADDIFKCIFFNENFWILHNISLKYVP